MIILGLSFDYHDSAAALLVDGEIVAAAQEERFTRRKHDERLPVKSIEFCLKFSGSACAEEQLKVQQWIESSLEDEGQYLCSLFLAFNFDTIIVSRLSYLLNGYRYSQIGLPSPFVYMMV